MYDLYTIINNDIYVIGDTELTKCNIENNELVRTTETLPKPETFDNICTYRELAYKYGLVFDEIDDESGSGGGEGGTDNYPDLKNKPQINGITLVGNKTTSDLGIDGGSGNSNIFILLDTNSGSTFDVNLGTNAEVLSKIYQLMINDETFNVNLVHLNTSLNQQIVNGVLSDYRLYRSSFKYTLDFEKENDSVSILNNIAYSRITRTRLTVSMNSETNKVTGVTKNSSYRYRFANSFPDLLTTTNTTSFTPTGDYNPATKKYVDDLIATIGSGIKELGGDGYVINPTSSLKSGIYKVLKATEINTGTTSKRYTVKSDSIMIVQSYSTKLIENKVILYDQDNIVVITGGDYIEYPYDFATIANSGSNVITVLTDEVIDTKELAGGLYYVSGATAIKVQKSSSASTSYTVTNPFIIVQPNTNGKDVVAFGGETGTNLMYFRLSSSGYLLAGTQGMRYNLDRLTTTNNTNSYNVTSDYNPAHKLYVDTAIQEAIAGISGGDASQFKELPTETSDGKIKGWELDDGVYICDNSKPIYYTNYNATSYNGILIVYSRNNYIGKSFIALVGDSIDYGTFASSGGKNTKLSLTDISDKSYVTTQINNAIGDINTILATLTTVEEA